MASAEVANGTRPRGACPTEEHREMQYPGGIEADRAGQDRKEDRSTRQAIMPFAVKVMEFIAKRTMGVGWVGKEREK